MSKKKITIKIGNKSSDHTISTRKEIAPSVKIVKSKKVYKRKNRNNNQDNNFN